MRSADPPIADDLVADLLADHWDIRVGALQYVAIGAGAYHWVARDADERRWFVTCDDLDTKPWFAADREAVFSGLRRAYRTAMELHGAGLEFVAAPVPAHSGEAAERVDERCSLAVLPYIEGEPGQWGRPISSQEREEVAVLLARLHQCPAPSVAPRRQFALPGREELEAALADVDRPWRSGPYADAARQELADGAPVVAQMLAEFDRHAARLAADDSLLVVTHGEPHPVNLMRTQSGLVLIDWDTVALARRERDLWMIDDEVSLAAYVRHTGATVDRQAMAAYRLLWALADLAAFTAQLRHEHRGDIDDEFAVTALRSIVSGREPAPYG
jgi:spectinomycin phosphotransferase